MSTRHDALYDPTQDLLERQWERLWRQIRPLLLRLHVLYARAELRGATPVDTLEIEHLERRIASLRRRTQRYREVLRDEANARVLGPVPKDPIETVGPDGTPVIEAPRS